MAEFKKRKMNTFWHSPIMLFVLFLILVIFSYNMVGLYKRERETANTKAIILDKMSQLQAREHDLSTNIDKLKTEAGKEEVIRDKYQVVKPGEEMLVIVDPDDVNSKNQNAPSGHGFVNWIKNIFK